MKRFSTIGYGVAAYVLFLVAFVYAVGFVGNLVVPRTVDHGLDYRSDRSGGVGQRVAARCVRRPAQRHGAAGVQKLVDAIGPVLD